MKALKIFLPIILILVVGFSWYSFLMGIRTTRNDYESCIKAAETSISDGLYEQAVEHYKAALVYNVDNEAIYVKIKETYDTYYAEEHTAFVRSIYLSDMIAAATAFPQKTLFWETQVDLYVETEDYGKAYAVIAQAQKYGAASEEMKLLYKELSYSVKLDFEQYEAHKTALNGYITVYEDGHWSVIDHSGEQVRSTYPVIGLLNDNGKGIYQTAIDARLLDRSEIARARFDLTIEDAGYYNETDDVVPVKIDGKWRYLRSSGELWEGVYEIAGSFYNGKAVASSGNGWVLLDATGKTEPLPFEDIKLDLYGCHDQNGIVLAKEGGKYRIYDTSFQRVGDFEADDVDICVDGKGFAFCKDGKWGFADVNGAVLLAPTYTKAKSFSRGYAAVCNEEGRWGFLNSRYELVIDYAYLDAFYFTSAETCLVSAKDGTVQLLRFVYN